MCPAGEGIHRIVGGRVPGHAAVERTGEFQQPPAQAVTPAPDPQQQAARGERGELLVQGGGGLAQMFGQLGERPLGPVGIEGFEDAHGTVHGGEGAGHAAA